jgi:membrane protein
MSVKERKLFHIDETIMALKAKEKSSRPGAHRCLAHAKTWTYRLYYEFLKNDVSIRAESLSYFTLFSIMPLMTGIFLFLSLFAKWTPIQKEFDGLIQNFLQAIPDDQRATIMQFITEFREEYLARLASRSSIIGFFAFLALIWISGKIFFNLEALMNRIWAVKRDRKFFDRIQNFVICMVIFPFSYVLALSLPRIIRHAGQRDLGHFMHQGVPAFIIFSSLIFIFRYFPNTRVKWRNAGVGAAVSTIGFGISNFILTYYFRFGTSTAYGKAGILPIFAFFIYVSWMIFIMGAEMSLLSQTANAAEVGRLPQTTFAQALLLEKVLQILSARSENMQPPISIPEISDALAIARTEIEIVLRFLRNKNVVVLVEKTHPHDENLYFLPRTVSDIDLIDLIKDFLDLSSISQKFDVIHLITRLK